MGIKILLKNDWDVNINSPTNAEKRGHFVGREKEIELLVNEISNKPSGSILISGHRGVGKTALVYSALWEAKAKNSNIIPVIINASQLETGEDNSKEINPRNIIENLIRRVYSVIKTQKISDEIMDDIEKLYRKAVAKEFKLFENYQQALINEQLTEREEIKEISLTQDIKDYLILLSWVLGTFFLTTSSFFPNGLEWLQKLFGLLAFPTPFVLKYFWTKREKKQKIEKSKVEAGEIYEFDNSISNLEFDLEQIHKKISKNSKKLVYVIDELDKLETKQVMLVLKYFKNLFTISDAIFIFIGGEEFYKYGEEIKSQNEIYRPKEYTYFNSKYFLQRPLWEDLDKYFEEIKEKMEGNESDWMLLKRILSFESKNDFFDLKNCIRNRISFDKNSKSIIKIESILDEDIKKARFHKSAIILFTKYMSHQPLKWYENERLLRKLFEYSYSLFNSFSGIPQQDPNTDKIEDALIRDFNMFLHRLGALNWQNETQQNLKGINLSIRTYSYTGNIPVEPPEHLDYLTEFEHRFVNEFEKFCKYIIALNNVIREVRTENKISFEAFINDPTPYTNQINNWNVDVSSQFNTHFLVYKNIKGQKPPFAYRREDIENRTNQLKSFIDKSLIVNTQIIISRILQNSTPNTQLNTIQQNGNLFSGSASQIRTALNQLNPWILFKNDYSRQIAFLFDNLNIFQSQSMRKQIKDNQQTHRILVVALKKEELNRKGIHIINVEKPETIERELPKICKELIEFISG